MIIKGVNKNLDLSVSGVLVFGDETFDDVTDYDIGLIHVRSAVYLEKCLIHVAIAAKQ